MPVRAARWSPNFDVYRAVVDDLPAVFLVDLAAAEHAPLETHPIRLQIRVKLASAREDGLRDAGEADAINAVEDALVQRLEARVDAVYVGRFTNAGHTVFVFYFPAAHAQEVEKSLPEMVGPLPHGYEPEWLTDEDADWDYYVQFLAPDLFAHQQIENRRVLDEMVSQGDLLDSIRTVDHLVFFPDEDAAASAAASLRESGFEVDEPSEPDGEGRVGLEFHRPEKLSDGRPDEFCAEVLEIVVPLEGEYDGWGTIVVRGDA
jgi:regulator of RNase E activity RraB